MKFSFTLFKKIIDAKRPERLETLIVTHVPFLKNAPKKMLKP